MENTGIKYMVQIGRCSSVYTTRYTLDSLSQAGVYYSGINIGNGYKKRLIDSNGKVYARLIDSYR